MRASAFGRYKMSKSSKFLKFIFVLAAILLVSVTAVACNKDPEKYTLTFTAEGLDIASIQAEEGSTITPPADPSREGFVFAGWYDNADFNGEPITLPTVMPGRNVNYYAKFESLGSLKIIYDINMPVSHTGNVTPTYGNPGDSVTVKDGSAYKVNGYLFIGWSTEVSGLVSQFGSKQEGQYLAGDTLTFIDRDVTLYAQWAHEVQSKTETSDKLYFYYEYVGKGNGAVILVREGKPNKLGFVSERELAGDDYYTFEFYFGEEDEYGIVGVAEGRIYDDNTYVFSDGFKGSFLYYDYITKSYDRYILTADGFGRATISEVVQESVATRYYGRYELDPEYGDYLFTYMNPETGSDIMDGEYPAQSYMRIELGEVAGIQNNRFLGSFTYLGMESGSYLWYDNGELLNYRLDLNGYGSARLYSYDAISDTSELVSEGEYYGSDNYADEYGEWIFKSAGEEFKFIVNMISDPQGNIPVYIEYNESMNKTLTSANNDGSTLYLDGYGSAEYVAAGVHYVGYITVSESGNLFTYTPYIDNGDGTMSASGTMYFNVQDGDKFKVNTTDLVIDGTTLTAYKGTSRVIVIPDEVTAIADDVFNYTKTDVSVISVTVPAGVTSIGARAFENEHSLQRVVFLSATPIDIDFSAENDPFRWPAGSFVIVVPEGSQDAYKKAWIDDKTENKCKYAIKGSEEVTRLPEYEVNEDGVLTRYNVQPGSEDAELNLVLPDEATSIAENVFRGLENLKSIDLNNVTAIGEGAFEFCINLESVVFTNVKTIGAGAFAGCESLGLTADGIIELPSVTHIGASAFQSCYELLHVRIGADIVEIGSFAFAETNMKSTNGPLFIELSGDVAPQMGEKVFNGNIATRIKVKDINVVLDCYLEPTFAKYNRHLYIESGEEKGLYFDGSDTLELDGRAVLASSYVLMYVIDGEKITFYEFSEENSAYYSVEGTYIDGIITVKIDRDYSFKKAKDIETYASEDGKYTLECNPRDLLPEKYESTGFAGYADVRFNGQNVKMYIAGYNIKRISNFLDADGIRYDFDITLDGGTLVYVKTVSDTRVIVTASDGSSLTIHTSGNFTYIYGTLKIVVGRDDKTGADILMPDNDDYGVYATSINGNVYTFVRDYRGTKYTITITVTGNTFTYTYVTNN